MNAFTKIVRPGTTDTGHPRQRDYFGKDGAPVFCKIEFDGKKLSISGVEGPLGHDALGSCGQIVMHIEGDYIKKYAPGWDAGMFQRFVQVWHDWHLNDMHAYDSEMKAAGWREKAKTPMRGYEFSLTHEMIEAQRVPVRRVQKLLHAGEAAQYTPDVLALIHKPYSLEVWLYASEPEPAVPEGYEKAKDTSGNVKHPEHKTLGWLCPKEHPDGLLGRKLREDGPGYGSAWYFEPVPEDVLQWLQALPDSDMQPAWV